MIPPEVVCLEISTIHVLALNYLVALYPLILIVITYISIELHARNIWPLVWMWKPVQYCFTSCGIRRQWNFKSSIIEAFASFLLLSLGKMLSISFDLLVPMQLYNIHGEQVNNLCCHSNCSADCVHIVATIAATTVSTEMLPQVFTDAFQGAYKNGTNGTWDC